MLRLTSLPVALLVLCSCSRFSEEKWFERSARVSCKTARRCDTTNFWYHYDSLGACIDETKATSLELYAGCVYDKAAAKDCEHAMEWSCKKIGERYDELQSLCAAVWACDAPDDTAIDTGGLAPL